MNFINNSNILENFLANFLRQYKDPMHFNFFKASAKNVESNVMFIDEMLKDPDKQSNKKMLDSVHVDFLNFDIREKQNCLDFHTLSKERVKWVKFRSPHAI